MIQRVKHLLTVRPPVRQRRARRIRYQRLHLPLPHLRRSPWRRCSRTRTRLRHRRRVFRQVLLNHLLPQHLPRLPRPHSRRPPFATPRLSNKPLHRVISHIPCLQSPQQRHPSSPPPLRSKCKRDLGIQTNIIGDPIPLVDLDRRLLHMHMVSRRTSTCTNLMDGGRIRFFEWFATCFKVASSLIIDTLSCFNSVPLSNYIILRVWAISVTVVTLENSNFFKILIRYLFGISL